MKLDKVIAYVLMIMMIGSFLTAFVFGINKTYFVPKIDWSNISETQEFEIKNDFERRGNEV
jgi:hypothetical protein